MESNLSKQEFEKVWSEVKIEAPQTFTFLERLEKKKFMGDPLKWK